MSVIVALKENETIYMGADTQITAGNKKENGLNESSFKISKLDNDILVGFCGNLSQKQKILSVKNLFCLDKNNELSKRHIVQSIIPKLIEIVSSSENKECSLLVSILLAHKNNLFKITPSFDVIKINEYSKAGAGLLFIDYPIQNGIDFSPEKRLLNAMQASAKRTESVSGPYVLIDTRSLSFKIFDLGGNNF